MRRERAELSAIDELERGGDNGEDVQFRNRLLGFSRKEVENWASLCLVGPIHYVLNFPFPIFFSIAYYIFAT